MITPWTPFLDLQVSQFFYKEGHFIENGFTKWMFDYTERIGFVVVSCSLGILLLSLFIKKWKSWRRNSLTLVLSLCIGAGCIINSGFKEHWGRPRPKQIVKFGGRHSYHPLYTPSFNKKHKSFPSGHAAVGFYYLSFVVVGRRARMKILEYFGWAGTIFFGVGVSLTRIAQGGHFLSDVLYSFLIMWEVILILDYIHAKIPITWEEVKRSLGLSKAHYISQSHDSNQ